MSFVKQTMGSGAAALNQDIVCSATPGNALYMFYARSGGLATGAVTTVTDTGGNVWQLVTRGAVSGSSNTRIELWTCPATASPGTITVKSTVSQTNSWGVLEFSGYSSFAEAASPDNSAVASSATVATPALTALDSNRLVLAAAHFGKTTTSGLAVAWTATTDFDDGTVGSGRAAWQVASTRNITGASWTLAAAKAAGVITAAFAPNAVSYLSSSGFWFVLQTTIL